MNGLYDNPEAAAAAFTARVRQSYLTAGISPHAVLTGESVQYWIKQGIDYPTYQYWYAAGGTFRKSLA
jgi:hypothetical protein